MAYSALPSSWYDVGKALKRQLFQRLATNIEDHESRINLLSLGASPIEVFDFPVLNASSSNSLTGLTYFQAKTSFIVSTVQLQIFEKGIISSGVVGIDVLKSSTLGGIYTTILTTPPSINFSTASDYELSSATLDPAEQSVAQGEYLRLDVTSLPAVTLGKFRVLVYGNV